MPLPLANPPTQSRVTGRLANRTIPLPILDAPAPLRLWHLASLDAPTVAVVWSLGFARAANVSLPVWVPILLGLGTWAVYIGDRLLDARSALHSGNLSHLRERHYFHWTHRRALAPLALGAATASVAIILSLMPAALQERNSVLGVAALVYFSWVHVSRKSKSLLSRILSKELLVGLLFTAGCAFPALSRLGILALPATQFWPLLITIAFFALLAWVNCCAIDRWEAGVKSSIAVSALSLGVTGLILAIVLSPYMTAGESTLLVQGSASALLLALLDRFRGHMLPVMLRASADLVLLLPLLLLA